MWPFLLNHFLYEEGGDGQKVNLVGHTFGRLHCGDIGVDEHGLDALFLQGFQGLAARVVELACLTNL